MSEKLAFKPEQQEVMAALPTAEQAEPLRKGEQDPVKALKQARETVSETAQAESQLNPIEALHAAEKSAQPATPTHVSRELGDITAKRELHNIQRQESAPKRQFSKVIHQPVIRAVSETAGKTVSRPSGLLGGGLVAFLGTTSYFYLAQHVGFTYNYFVVILLMIGGFALGIILELFVYMATASRRGNNNS
ncbi:MAG: hypothetical protein AAB462_04065 [Patescibacteria group bacterium]